MTNKKCKLNCIFYLASNKQILLTSLRMIILIRIAINKTHSGSDGTHPTFLKGNLRLLNAIPFDSVILLPGKYPKVIISNRKIFTIALFI